MKHLFLFILCLITAKVVLAQTTCPAPLPGSTQCHQTSRPNNGNQLVNFPPIPHQDCCNALPVLTPFSQISNGALIPVGAPSGTYYPGCVQNELPADANTCFSNNEKATTWYKFKVGPLPGGPTANGSPAGKLRFKIVPQDVIGLPDYNPALDSGNLSFGQTDYDFLLFNVSDVYSSNSNVCSAIKNSSAYGTPNSRIVSCNWTGTRGPTGLFEPGIGAEMGTGKYVRFNRPINVTVGEIFYLAIDNFSTNIQGFLLDFRGQEAIDDSTAQLFSPDDDPFHSNLITGTVFLNSNNDCVQDATETGLGNHVLFSQPGSYYAMTNGNGGYQVQSDSGNYTVTPLQFQLHRLLESIICPTSGSYSGLFNSSEGDTASGKNFAINQTLCPLLTIGVGSDRRRRCARNHTTITASNIGTVPSDTNTTVFIKLPKYVSFISASKPHTFNPVDSTYQFKTGPIPSDSKVAIQIIDSVSCVNGILGKEQCTKAWIRPENTCYLQPAGWDGADIKIKAGCSTPGNQPVFTIKNVGSSMVSAGSYKVYIGSNLAYTQSVQLAGGDSLVFLVPTSDTNNVRVEMNQTVYHPFSTFAVSEVRCSGNGQGPILFSPDNGNPQSDVDCMPIRDSYDPNDKQVQPRGITNAGLIEPERPLEYKIRFQNTGNDIAYRVVVVDTLSESLDLSTFEELGSSHNYSLNIGGREKPVIRFIFENINLPDSASDPEMSSGFVRFRIKPKTSAALGTKIFNHAEIYFDFNDPIITNKTLNTLYLPTVVPDIIDSVIILGTHDQVREINRISLVPNPNKGQFEARSSVPTSVTVFSIEGKELIKSSEHSLRHSFDLTRFRKGMYLVEFVSKGERKVSKLIID